MAAIRRPGGGSCRTSLQRASLAGSPEVCQSNVPADRTCHTAPKIQPAERVPNGRSISTHEQHKQLCAACTKIATIEPTQKCSTTPRAAAAAGAAATAADADEDAGVTAAAAYSTSLESAPLLRIPSPRAPMPTAQRRRQPCAPPAGSPSHR
eukprot:365102-Chlamydomonas_euryale.AAC.10